MAHPAPLAVLFACVAFAGSALAQTPELIADINDTGTPESAFDPEARDVWAQVGGYTIFAANTAETGTELFRATPTTQAELVRDIWPGVASSSPRLGLVANGTLYFTADDGESGVELWRTDGTPAGTRRFADFNPGIVPSFPEILAADSHTLLTSAMAGPLGFQARELVWFDLQTGAARQLTDYTTQPIIREPKAAAALGDGRFVFTATGAPAGHELFVTDGTVANTKLVLDINPGPIASAPLQLTPLGGEVYFLAQRKDYQELWRTDGTPAGTAFVQRIWNERHFEEFGRGELVTNGQVLVYCAFGRKAGFELVQFDGTTITGLTDINPPTQCAPMVELMMDGNEIYFTMAKPTPFASAEVWKATTTPFTERLLADLKVNGPSFPQDFTEAGGRVYFTADDGNVGRELWSTDGTTAGTLRAGDLAVGPETSDPQNLVSTGSTLMFSARSLSDGRELFQAVNGVASLHTDVNPIKATVNSSPLELAQVAGRGLYFTANGGPQGREPFAYSDAQGLVALGDLNPDGGSAAHSFTGHWNGAQTQVFFSALDPAHGAELWVHDDQGARRVVDGWAGPASSSPQELTSFGGALYFTARTANGSRELFQTDGTASGTLQVVASNPNVDGDVRALRAGQRALYFTRVDDQGARHLYAVNEQGLIQIGAGLTGNNKQPNGLATLEGALVFQVVDLLTNIPALYVYGEATGSLTQWPLPIATHSASVDSETAVHGGRYYFALHGSVTRNDLFSIEPHTGDLRLHHAPGSTFSEFRRFVSAGERLYYAFVDSTFGLTPGELYFCTTAAGSGQQAVDLAQSVEDNLGPLAALGDRAYFRVTKADDPTLRLELLRSGPFNGVETNEVAASGYAPGPGGEKHGAPSQIVAANGDLFFDFALPVASGQSVGRELYRLKAPEASALDHQLWGSGGRIESSTPNLGGSLTVSGSHTFTGGAMALVLGAPAEPYALAGVATTDAACIAIGSLQVLGVSVGNTLTYSGNLPASPSLIGAQLALQGVTVDLLTPNAPLHLTNAKLLTLGL